MVTNKGITAKRHIIETALELFKEKGYQHTSMVDICQAAKIATGTFYHYFKSKQDVLSEYITQENEGVLDFFQSLQEATQTAVILKFVAYKAQIYEKRGPELVSDLYISLVSTRTVLSNRVDQTFSQVIEEAYQAGQQSGEFILNVSPQSFTDTAACLFFYTTLLWCFQPGYLPLQDTITAKFEEILQLHRVDHYPSQGN